MGTEYHRKLRQLMDEYVHEVYKITRKFPKEEIYGITSQFRRASLSIVLNYIEGYSRFKEKVHKNFIETSFGSLKESRYLLEFSNKEHYIDDSEYAVMFNKINEIGAMLWGMLRNMRKYENN